MLDICKSTRPLRRNDIIFDDEESCGSGWNRFGRINSIRGEYAETYIGDSYKIIPLKNCVRVNYKGRWENSVVGGIQYETFVWMPTLKNLKRKHRRYARYGEERKSQKFSNFVKIINFKKYDYPVYRNGKLFQIYINDDDFLSLGFGKIEDETISFSIEEWHLLLLVLDQ